LIIEDGVKEIGTDAFYDCVDIKTLSIPGTISQGSLTGYFSDFGQLATLFYQGTRAWTGCHFSRVTPTICVPKNYEGEEFCGVYVSSDNETCKEFQELFNECYVGAYIDGNIIQKMSSDAIEWENQTGVCGDYICDNNTGLLSWSKCNSTDATSKLCIQDECMEDWENNLGGWSVEITVSGVKFEQLNKSEIIFNINKLSQVKAEDMSIGVETDKQGNITAFVVSVKNETCARNISEGVKNIPTGSSCKYGILCYKIDVTIHHNNDPSGSSTPSSASSTKPTSSGTSSSNLSSASTIHCMALNMMMLFVTLLIVALEVFMIV